MPFERFALLRRGEPLDPVPTLRIYGGGPGVIGERQA